MKTAIWWLLIFIIAFSIGFALLPIGNRLIVQHKK